MDISSLSAIDYNGSDDVFLNNFLVLFDNVGRTCKYIDSQISDIRKCEVL